MGGERDAEFEQDFRRYGDIVFRRARRILGDGAEATDVTQDVFLSLYKHIGEVRQEARLAWLLRTADNRSLNRIRHRNTRRRLLSLVTIHQEREAEKPRDHFANERLLALIASENEDTREILIRHYVDGLSLAKIAKEVGRPPRTVQRLHERFLNRARKRLYVEEESQS